MASILVYNRPSRSPSSIQGIIDTLNASGENLAFPVAMSPIRTGFVRVFGGESGDQITSVTPDPDVSVSWHRNRVDTPNKAVIQMAEAVRDHRGRYHPVVTGWLAGEDGKNRPFAASPLTPRNPGGVTGYGQSDNIVQAFVAAAKISLGKEVDILQHGMSCSLPVKTGRGRNAPTLQVTGLTVARMDCGDALLFDGTTTEFQADPMGMERPALQKREVLRIKGNQYWTPIAPLTAEYTGGSVEYSVEAFLDTLTG